MRDTENDQPAARTPSRRGVGRLRAVRASAVLVVVASATAVFAGFLELNRLEHPALGPVLAWWAATTLVGLTALGVLVVATRAIEPVRLAFVVAVVIYAFFSFHRLADPAAPALPQVLGWSALTAGAAAICFALSRWRPARRFLVLFVAFLGAIPALSYGAYWLSTPGPDREITEPPPIPPTVTPIAAELADAELEPSTLPNIYLFVFDERARGDQLDAVFGVDTADFEHRLTEAGFSVSHGSYAPYPRTLLSLSSLFEMDNVATEVDDVANGIVHLDVKLRGDNAVVRDLRSRGYTFVYTSPGIFDWLACDARFADVCVDPDGRGLGLSEANSVLLGLTPLGLLDRASVEHTDPLYVLDHARPHLDRGRPLFVYGHILSPHGPFIYDADCELRPMFLDVWHLEDGPRREAYLQDLGCSDAFTLEAVERIVTGDPDAYVILLSDHGSNFLRQGAALDEWSDEGLRERFGVLDAVRAPGCASLPDERASIVNLFRHVLACLDGTEAELVEDRAFVWHDSAPDVLDEIAEPTARFAPPPTDS